MFLEADGDPAVFESKTLEQNSIATARFLEQNSTDTKSGDEQKVETGILGRVDNGDSSGVEKATALGGVDYHGESSGDSKAWEKTALLSLLANEQSTSLFWDETTKLGQPTSFLEEPTSSSWGLTDTWNGGEWEYLAPAKSVDGADAKKSSSSFPSFSFLQAAEQVDRDATKCVRFQDLESLKLDLPDRHSQVSVHVKSVETMINRVIYGTTNAWEQLRMLGKDCRHSFLPDAFAALKFLLNDKDTDDHKKITELFSQLDNSSEDTKAIRENRAPSTTNGRALGALLCVFLDLSLPSEHTRQEQEEEGLGLANFLLLVSNRLNKMAVADPDEGVIIWGSMQTDLVTCMGNSLEKLDRGPSERRREWKQKAVLALERVENVTSGKAVPNARRRAMLKEYVDIVRRREPLIDEEMEAKAAQAEEKAAKPAELVAASKAMKAAETNNAAEAKAAAGSAPVPGVAPADAATPPASGKAESSERAGVPPGALGVATPHPVGPGAASAVEAKAAEAKAAEAAEAKAAEAKAAEAKAAKAKANAAEAKAEADAEELKAAETKAETAQAEAKAAEERKKLAKARERAAALDTKAPAGSASVPEVALADTATFPVSGEEEFSEPVDVPPRTPGSASADASPPGAVDPEPAAIPHPVEPGVASSEPGAASETGAASENGQLRVNLEREGAVTDDAATSQLPVTRGREGAETAKAAEAAETKVKAAEVEEAASPEEVGVPPTTPGSASADASQPAVHRKPAATSQPRREDAATPRLPVTPGRDHAVTDGAATPQPVEPGAASESASGSSTGTVSTPGVRTRRQLTARGLAVTPQSASSRTSNASPGSSGDTTVASTTASASEGDTPSQPEGSASSTTRNNIGRRREKREKRRRVNLRGSQRILAVEEGSDEHACCG
ncbi:unnamed protein product [Amoebophrya sp. A25]|nr:unnamed protein product [Amoebophrya sp. A25]|eukprot:GSA25T00012585001.1